MIAPNREEIVYRVDAEDRIVSVNGAWREFARENEGAGLDSDQLLGRSIWDFIADPTTRQLYAEILTRVRQGRNLQFNFRCDSPTCRRRLQMAISQVSEGQTEFRTSCLSLEEREPQSLLDHGRTTSQRLIRVCGWCNQFEVGDEWVEVEEALDRLGVFDDPVLPELTHGICPQCLAEMTKTIEESVTSTGAGP